MSAVIEEGKVVVEPAFSRVEDRAQPVAMPADQSPASMLALAVQKNMAPEIIAKFMDLRDRWEAAEAKKAFDAALAAFKANPPELKKNKHVHYPHKDGGGKTDYWHATLDHVSVEIGKSLAPHGLSHRWDVEQLTGGMIRVTCVLAHAAGHAVKVPMEASRDESGKKNNIQAVGSTVTYLQRYTLLAATGMAVGGQDDDGRNSEGGSDELLSEKQISDFIATFDEATDLTTLQASFSKAYKAAQALSDKEAMGIFTRAKDARKAALAKKVKP